MLALHQAGAEGLRMSDLAERRLMSTGGFTRLADRLERRGVIARHRSEVDGRSLTARMTPEGLKLMRRARREHHHDLQELFFNHLSEEQLHQLAEIWAALEPPANPG